MYDYESHCFCYNVEYAYSEGWQRASRGLPNDADKVYPPSGHERDTTFTDECNYAYHCGYDNFFEPEETK